MERILLLLWMGLLVEYGWKDGSKFDNGMNINIKHYQLLLYVSDYFHYFLESCLFLMHLQKMKQSHEYVPWKG